MVSDQWFGNVDGQWNFPPMRRLLQRLASFARLVLFDKRGTGLSDPVPIRAAPALEERVDDVRAVLEDAGIERTAMLCGVGATYTGVLFAATYTERTTALVVVNGYARMVRTADYPWRRTPEEIRDYVDRVRAGWGEGRPWNSWRRPRRPTRRFAASSHATNDNGPAGRPMPR